MTASPTKSWRHGECHCGEVGFAVNLPDQVVALSCNCSICKASGLVQRIVAAADFKLLRGEDALTDYRFHTGTAHHLFCKTCGVKSFYIPRSHPDGVSVNVNCLDPATIKGVTVTPFDGQNWEENVAEIRSPSGSSA